MDEAEVLNDIDKRVVAIEVDLRGMAAVRKIIWSLAGAVVIGATSAVYGYGQLTQKLDSINLLELETHISTLLVVVGDHGTELENVRSEQSSLRGKFDTINEHIFELRNRIDDQTKERFYKEDGSRLEGRILRIENRIFK